MKKFLGLFVALALLLPSLVFGEATDIPVSQVPERNGTTVSIGDLRGGWTQLEVSVWGGKGGAKKYQTGTFECPDGANYNYQATSPSGGRFWQLFDGSQSLGPGLKDKPNWNPKTQSWEHSFWCKD